MKEKCFNHPDKNSISFCHSCGRHFCEKCLSEGKEYYYCKDEKCQILMKEEDDRFQVINNNINKIIEQRWKEANSLFYKKAKKIFLICWFLLTLFLLVVVSPDYKRIYYLPITSLLICLKWALIVYFIRNIIYKRLWGKRLSEKLS
jgi:hypothetical protein